MSGVDEDNFSSVKCAFTIQYRACHAFSTSRIFDYHNCYYYYDMSVENACRRKCVTDSIANENM